MGEVIKESIENFGLGKHEKGKSMFSKIGVVGCGKDGRSIVNLTALAGMEVVFVDISEERVQYALNEISHSLDTKIQNWGLTQNEKRATMNRITGSINYADLKDCDLVIECIRYDADGQRSTELRKEAFKKLESVLAPDAIIATNATTVIISELAADLVHKERCVSLHFPIAHSDARLLEIVKGTFTSPEVLERVLLFAKLVKYTPIEVQESSGLVSLRLMVTMLNEACQMLMENLTSMENIDEEFRVIYGQRYGIFQLADIFGIEKLVMLMDNMFNEYGDKKYKAPPLLLRLYRSKQYGMSSGRGFYIYDEAGNKLKANDLI
ncbi:3-hydroxybutyryl-CoA dehydrogenase [Dysgonomonas sp. PH5-45]|uniref:3-hydroxyacyl-CoA dehydrogenase family protein n=1 Tax=unclassified Dysgonomonas TaxID=2630389 RepID=UPI0024737B79|nr:MULTISPECIES: 3-hydroxyacyl-CoA dehydrogenase family protein [unclassified Dysgonomonas]MDH6355083.1 3-hydroxybutyryl-CoA dehydrogenase [Dysgonomonas sp. PH5-45]MDH6387983.1 3-hydroxybutyryl-CoA dehydrogenase [Dysgonomonas sp. PH5-37]